jgi:hypothetical protein
MRIPLLSHKNFLYMKKQVIRRFAKINPGEKCLHSPKANTIQGFCMKRSVVIICCLALCSVLAIAAGCTSPVQTNATGSVTPTPPATVSLKDLTLSSDDLPQGYSIVYRGEMAPGDPNCSASEVCYLQGYFISAANGESNTSTIIDQAVVFYSKPAVSATLRAVLADQLPDIANGNLTPLADPGIGDASAAYRVTLPTAGGPVEGYIVIFGKGNLYEIFMVTGPDASERLVIDLARKASS